MIEGDNLDQAYPEPWRHGIDLAEQNLAAMWQNDRRAGYRRFIYTNTVSVLEAEALARRERGSALADHVARSAASASRLSGAPGATEVMTDGRGIVEIAREVLSLTPWSPPVGR